MILKKMISICFLFVLMLAASLWIDQKIHKAFVTPEKVQCADTETGTEAVTASVPKLPDSKYYLKEQDGKIAVYLSDRNTLYFETSIRIEELSSEMKDKLFDGLSFSSEKELFEFLENYSS